MRAKPIDPMLFSFLLKIEPSKDHGLEYRPCQVDLKDGRVLDRVVFVEEEGYIKAWGVYPEDGSGKRAVNVAEVRIVRESPYRLPPHLANKMYSVGESGMGYCVFTLVLRDGRELPYVTGNLIDFPTLPPGIVPDMIVDLLSHCGRERLQDDQYRWRKDNPYTQSAPYHWCLYNKPVV